MSKALEHLKSAKSHLEKYINTSTYTIEQYKLTMLETMASRDKAKSELQDVEEAILKLENPNVVQMEMVLSVDTPSIDSVIEQIIQDMRTGNFFKN